MSTQSPDFARKPQPRTVQSIDSTARGARRKRAGQIHQGALRLLDQAVEARRDTEEVAREYEMRRPDVQDLFAHCTRRELRKIQTELRALDARLHAMRAELFGRAA